MRAEMGLRLRDCSHWVHGLIQGWSARELGRNLGDSQLAALVQVQRAERLWEGRHSWVVDINHCVCTCKHTAELCQRAGASDDV